MQDSQETHQLHEPSYAENRKAHQPLHDFRGAIFDMDGTLLDSMPVWDQLSQRLLKPYGIQVKAADYAAIEGKTQLQGAEYFLRTYPQLPLDPPGFVRDMDALLTTRYATIAKPRDGILELLDGLQARGIPMAIATLTARRHTEKALRDRDMLHYFSLIQTMEDVGASKHEPTIYWKTAEGIRVAPSDCMVFEDTPYAGVTAKQGGFQVCGVAEPTYAADVATLRAVSDFFVERSFTELCGVLYE